MDVPEAIGRPSLTTVYDLRVHQVYTHHGLFSRSGSLSHVRMGEGRGEGFRLFFSLNLSEKALSLTLSRAYMGEGVNERGELTRL